ncbi:hypothetical protein Tco_0585358 [Tanacetum coccineum]
MSYRPSDQTVYSLISYELNFFDDFTNMALPPRDQRHEWLRGQSPEKVTTTDLFFLYSMKEGTVLGVHFEVITEQSLQTLTVKVRDLQTIDLEELIRLRIYERLVDTVALVVEGPQREQVGAASIDANIDPEIRQDASVVPRAAVSDVRGDDKRACQISLLLLYYIMDEWELVVTGTPTSYYRAIGKRWRKERVLEHKQRSSRKSTKSEEYDVSF